MCLPNYMSSKLVYIYDSENDDNYYLHHGAFALGGDTEEDFTRHHWMIDSGCTDHLSPFLDDFAHLGNMVRHTVVANGQKVPMYGPGKILLNQCIKGSEPLVLKEVWYTPHAGHRLLSVPTLTSQGYKCIISDQESSIWDANENLVIQACASSPNNNLHWFPSELMTPIRGLVNSLVKEDSYELWHQRFGHIAKNALRQAPFQVTGLPTVIAPIDTSPCKGCALGKMHDRSYPASGKRATPPLGLVHTDLVGPMPTELCTRARYVLTFIDDYSGYALVAFIRNKDATSQHFKAMVSWAETFTGHSLTSVHSDRGGEFMAR